MLARWGRDDDVESDEGIDVSGVGTEVAGADRVVVDPDLDDPVSPVHAASRMPMATKVNMCRCMPERYRVNHTIDRRSLLDVWAASAI